MKKVANSIFYLFFPLIVGSAVGFLISKNLDYSILQKPPLSPPSVVFPIAWSIIYLLMGISYYLLTKKIDYRPIEKIVYYTQLIVNFLWSIFFFVFKWRFFSIIWILLLLYLVVTMIRTFYMNSKMSAYLNIPYLLWILFATYLTIGIYLLN